MAIAQTGIAPISAEKIGGWVFRRRTWLPLILAAPLFIPAHPSIGTLDCLVIALGCALVGESIRLISVGYAGRVTRTRSGVLCPLVVAGPYRYVRNPLYLGNIAILAGIVSSFGHIELIAPAVLIALAYYSLVVRWEESHLSRVFGEEYVAYRSEVPRWLPRPSGCPPRSLHTLDLREALHSERGTLGMLVLALLAGYVALTLGL
jgi:protein-S-isoprenylcysteine O-methyltransferase Ste14